MPLLRIDVIEGRSEAELKELLDAIHCAMLAAFKPGIRPARRETCQCLSDSSAWLASAGV